MSGCRTFVVLTIIGLCRTPGCPIHFPLVTGEEPGVCVGGSTLTLCESNSLSTFPLLCIDDPWWNLLFLQGLHNVDFSNFIISSTFTNQYSPINTTLPHQQGFNGYPK